MPILWIWRFVDFVCVVCELDDLGDLGKGNGQHQPLSSACIESLSSSLTLSLHASVLPSGPAPKLLLLGLLHWE